MPFTLPENESLSRSWPAPYSPSSRATAVPSMKASHARRCTSSLSAPLVCDMTMWTSSPQYPTYLSMSRPPRAASTRLRTAARSPSLGRVWPPMPPTSALITDTVTLTGGGAARFDLCVVFGPAAPAHLASRAAAGGPPAPHLPAHPASLKADMSGRGADMRW